MNQFPLRREFNFLHKAVDPGLKGLIDGILSGEKVMTLQGPRGTSLACIASLLHASLKRTFVIVMADDDDARRLGADAAAFLGAGRASHLLPWDLPREDRLLFAQRDSSLARTGTITRLFWGESLLLCTSLKALMQRIVPRKALDAYCRVITAGDAIDRDDLVGLLVAGGYRRVPLVEAAGDFSARGDIIDLFVPTENRPYRMEFFGDEVESIRHFKPSTQRSSGEAEGIYLAPAGEIISTPERTALAVGRIRERAAQLGVPRTKRDRVLEMISGETPLNPSLGLLPYFYGPGDGDGGLDDLLAYVPASSIFIIDDRSRLEAAAETYEEEIDGAVERARREERLYPERSWFHLSADRLFERFDQFQTIGLDTVERPERGGPRFRIAVEENADLLKRDRTVGKDEDVLDTAVRRIRGWTDNRLRVFFFCAEREQERIASLLEGYELPLSPSSRSFLEDLADPALESRVILREGFVAGGFTAPGLGAIVVSEEEIFGKKVRRRRRQRYREGFFLKSFGDLNEGDHIVHVDHGIGIYLGLQRLSIGAIEGDFLLIEYLGGDKLYIPMDRLDQIQRYIGPEGQGPAVDRLGGGSWEAVKKKVSKSVRAVAEELVALYAAREVMEGFRFSPPDRHYEEFASSFEFEETPDQAKAIEDVQQDMSESKPMDRLICGDAGFGKTEVSIRAAFKAVMDGKQVAVLVPTTILAEQHFQTFTKRFDQYPVRIEVLNRYKTAREQRAIVDDLNRGLVDIVIGAHRLLQKDVEFKDLGLVVIDEEQRFGVAHKERLKKLRTLVDILTLTATPIPRTLQLSLVGIRDLSVIETPPEERQAATVFIAEFDDDVIAPAIRREFQRCGQVFFVHDRVQSIHRVARYLAGLVPEARIGIAHGQMKPRELEDVMIRFLRKELNLLVCTTIISSGVDVPSANTILINRADRFGLAQLYQLRGRVGRSKEEAFVYFLVPKGARITGDALKRLQVAQEFSEPGSGFKVATHDLEIRGGGNLLGVSQSGHISAVGFELYTELMETAVRELRGDRKPELEIRPEIHLGFPAFIPDEYIADMHLRLLTYKKISIASDDEEIAKIREELQDCYGVFPPEVRNLIAVIALRNRMKACLVTKVSYDGRTLAVSFHEQAKVDPAKIVELTKRYPRNLVVSPEGRLTLRPPALETDRVVGFIEDFLRDAGLVACETACRGGAVD